MSSDSESNSENNGKTNGHKNRHHFSRRDVSEDENSDDRDSNEESDEDDYDSEEDEEEPRQRKRRRDNHYGFVIEEAEVDDDGDDDEEWDNGVQELGIDLNEADEVGPTAREIEGRQRGYNLWDNQREEDIENYFRRKYATSPSHSSNNQFGNGENMSEEIHQQALLPSVKDPNLWLLRCRKGEEKTTALLLMRKFLSHENSDQALQIKSVVSPDSLKGYIYIEAYKQTHVKEAIENIGNLKMGFWRQQMVPINEMTDVLKVIKEEISLRAKQWVRPKRGIYKNDIAQVDFVDLAQNKVHLKLIPRIDYTKKRGVIRNLDDIENDEEEEIEEVSRKRKKKGRAPPKLFDPEAIRAAGGEITPDGDFLMFENNRYSAKGFIYKTYKCNAIITDGVRPTLSELEIFEDSPEDMIFAVSDNLNGKEAVKQFSPGDKVEVCSGELTNLQGIISSIDNNVIMVLPSHEELSEPLEFQANELKKCFSIGDHVKVIAGKYEGDTGLVIRVEANHLVVFSDISMHEMEILTRDLQLCPDVTTGVDSMGQFQWGDLVTFDGQTVGVIVRLESEIFHILSMHGKIVEKKPQGLSKKTINSRACALDSHQNNIVRNDVVQVIDGPHSGRSGRIKYLYRGFAFIQAQKLVENGGIMVCKTRHLQLEGGAKILPENSSSDFMPPKAIASPMAAVSPIHTPNEATDEKAIGLQDFSGNHSGGGGKKNRQNRELVGATVKIIRGPYKGQVGYCKDATETTVRVELTSMDQLITFSRLNVLNMNEPAKTVKTLGPNAMYRQLGSKTPMYGSIGATPMYDNGSRTPHYGHLTPSHDGSRTPSLTGAWDPSVTNTPARLNDFDNFSVAGGDISPTSFTKGYDPSVAPYTPQLTDSEDWDAEDSSTSKSTKSSIPKPANIPMRRPMQHNTGPLRTFERNTSFNRYNNNNKNNIKIGIPDEDWDNEEDGNTRFDPRSNERPTDFNQSPNIRNNWNSNNNRRNNNMPIKSRLGYQSRNLSTFSNSNLNSSNNSSYNSTNNSSRTSSLDDAENWDDDESIPVNNNNNLTSTPSLNNNSRPSCTPATIIKEMVENKSTNHALSLNTNERWDDEDDNMYNNKVASPPPSPKLTSLQPSSEPHVEISPKNLNSLNSKTLNTSNSQHPWLSQKLVVLIKDSNEDWDLAGQAVIVNSISGNVCNITLISNEKKIDIDCRELEPCLPEVNELVKIIKGEFRNKVGVLQSYGNMDSVVRFETGETQIISLDSVCKRVE